MKQAAKNGCAEGGAEPSVSPSAAYYLPTHDDQPQEEEPIRIERQLAPQHLAQHAWE